MDGYYQKREVSLDEVVRRVHVGDPAYLPRLILCVSPCRSGSTILLRVFGAVGVESHYQELKNILRWRMQGGEMAWHIPQRPGATLFLKETLGPYTETEARFDPLDVLLRAGFPAEKLHLLVLGRAVSDTWASWLAWWRGRTNFHILTLAYRTTDGIRRRAIEMGLPVTTFVYEALRDHPAKRVIAQLFARLHVPFAPVAVEGWHALPRFGSPASHVVFPQEPPAFQVPGLHSRPENADALTYYAHPEEVRLGEEAAIPTAIYEGWRRACIADLELPIGPTPAAAGRSPDSG